MQIARAFRIDGLDTVVFDEGEGPSVVMLHGMAATSDCWQYTFNDLKTDHRAIAPDLPGHGRSAGQPRPYSLGWYVGWLDALLNHLGLADITLMGSSMGGGICVAYAAQHPERVRRLIIVNGLGVGGGVPWHSLILLARRLPALLVLFASRRLDPFLFWYLRQRIVVNPEGYARSPLETMAKLNLKRGFWAIWAGARLLIADFLTNSQRRAFLNNMASIQLPTLIAWGRHDGLLPISHAYTAQERMCNARLHIFEHSAHLPMLEEPEMFNRVLRSFLVGN